MVPVSGLHIADPVANTTPTLSAWRHGKADSTAWGAGIRYRLGVVCSYADGERLQAGPCSTGKIRAGDYDAGAVYSSSNLSGYLDCYIYGQPSIDTPNPQHPQHLETIFDVLAPAVAHSETDAPADLFFGHYDRGYMPMYYVEIEGLPYRFCEYLPAGITTDDRTDSPRLVVDGSQKIHHKLDRYKGVSGASGFSFGIQDRDNSLGIFRRPAAEVQLSASAAYNTTTLTFAAGTSSPLGSSGVVYLGKEALKFTGNSGTNITVITRPFGPGYDYSTATIKDYRTATTSKVCWNGCEVSLVAMLVDPFGRAVDSTWGGTYSREVYSGEIKGVPGYSNGVWVFQTRDLIRRLTTSLGDVATGKTSMSLATHIFGVGAVSPAASTVVRGGNIQVIFESEHSSAPFNITTTIAFGGSNYSSFWDSLQAGFTDLMSKSITYGGATTKIGNSIFLDLAPVGFFSTQDDGDLQFGFFLSMVSGGYLDTINRIRFVGGSTAPSWMGAGFDLYNKATGDEPSNTVPKIRIPGGNGKNTDFLAIEQAPNTTGFSGSWSGAPYFMVEGENGKVEVCKAGGVGSLNGKILLTLLTRGLVGDPVNFHAKEREVVQCERFTQTDGSPNSLGSQMAALLESSGNTSERGAFDVYASGLGYALKASNHVYDSALTVADPGKSFTGFFPEQCDLVLTGKHSFEKIFGGTVAALGGCVAWVRDGSDLKIGVTGTTPHGQKTQYTITDSDLMGGNPVSVAQVGSGPNEVTVKQSFNPAGEDGSKYTFRCVEDMKARGGHSKTLELYGFPNDVFYLYAASYAKSLVQNGSKDVAYRLKVKPSRDWLAGQLVRLTITHPGIWDWKNNIPGIDDIGRITEVRRDLSRGEVEIVVLTSARSSSPALCPSAVVTASTTSGGNTVLTLSDSSIYAAGDGIRIYNPGANTAQDMQVLSVAGSNVTTNGAVGFTPTNNYTCTTYPLDTAGTITEDQAAFFSHIADGGVYV